MVRLIATGSMGYTGVHNAAPTHARMPVRKRLRFTAGALLLWKKYTRCMGIRHAHTSGQPSPHRASPPRRPGPHPGRSRSDERRPVSAPPGTRCTRSWSWLRLACRARGRARRHPHHILMVERGGFEPTLRPPRSAPRMAALGPPRVLMPETGGAPFERLRPA